MDDSNSPHPSSDASSRAEGEGKGKKEESLRSFYDFLLAPDNDEEGDKGLCGLREEDEIFTDEYFDAEGDEKNQRWMEKKEMYYCRKNRKDGRRGTDAVLSCPLCFSILCVDCQRHDRFKTQYRAMFASNCKVCFDEPMVDYSGGSASREDEPTFWKVRCVVCKTEVAAYDEDQVFHFYNTFSGY